MSRLNGLCTVCNTNHRDGADHPFAYEDAVHGGGYWDSTDTVLSYLPCGHDVSELINGFCVVCSELHKREGK